MNIINHNSNILNPVNQEAGFMVGRYEELNCYAAVPIMGSTTRLAIIFKGKVIKECRNRQSAVNFIDRHMKSDKK